MATLNDKVIVHYDGSDYGRIYLGDVGQRHQLGTGRGLYSFGQDRYISHGEDATFVTTSDVLLSQDRGRIKHFVTTGAFTVA